MLLKCSASETKKYYIQLRLLHPNTVIVNCHSWSYSNFTQLCVLKDVTFLSSIFIPVTHCAEEGFHLLCVFWLRGFSASLAFILSLLFVRNSLLLVLWLDGSVLFRVVVVLLFLTLVLTVLRLLFGLLLIFSFIFFIPLCWLVIVFNLRGILGSV